MCLTNSNSSVLHVIEMLRAMLDFKTKQLTAAFPPFFKMSIPAWVAKGWLNYGNVNVSIKGQLSLITYELDTMACVP